MKRFIATDGMVLDTKTHLEWWQDLTKIQRVDWNDAVSYIESLGDGWRLPTVRELLSLSSYTKGQQSLLESYKTHPFLIEKHKLYQYFWSSSTIENHPDCMWVATPLDFLTEYQDKNMFLNFVWPVRGIPIWLNG